MFVVTYRKIFFILSAILVIISIGAMIYFGFELGIDFKGGTITQVSYGASTGPVIAPLAPAPQAARPDQNLIKSELDKLDLGNYLLQPTGQNGYSLRTRELVPEEKDKVLAALSLNNKNPITVENYNSIGPVIGNELKNKALYCHCTCNTLYRTFHYLCLPPRF
jgi:preprotein translocase subunit SecF